jgi:hypothetical protein
MEGEKEEGRGLVIGSSGAVDGKAHLSKAGCAWMLASEIHKKSVLMALIAGAVREGGGAAAL